jgi:ATP-dependent DNA ligase
VHEVKFDGYRLLALVECGAVRLLTRRGHAQSRTTHEAFLKLG